MLVFTKNNIPTYNDQRIIRCYCFENRRGQRDINKSRAHTLNILKKTYVLLADMQLNIWTAAQITTNMSSASYEIT